MKTPLLQLTLLTSFGLLIVIFSATPGITEFAHLDFFDYYYAARAITEGVSPYDTQWADAAATSHSSAHIVGSDYIYPAWFAIVLRPLALLEPASAALVWWIGSSCAFILSIALLFAHRPQLSWLTLVFPPVLMSLFLGQSNFFLLALIALAYCLHDRNAVGAGILLGIATGIKLTPILLLVYLLYKRHWLLVGTSMLTLLSFAVLGEVQVPGSTKTYLFEIAPAAAVATKQLTHPVNQSLLSMIARFTTPNHWTFAWTDWPALGRGLWLSVSMTLLGYTYTRIRTSNHEVEEGRSWAGIVCLMVLLSPLAWEATFSLMVFPLAFMTKRDMALAIPGFLLISGQRALDGFAHNPDNYTVLQYFPLLVSLATVGAFLIWLSLIRPQPT